MQGEHGWCWNAVLEPKATAAFLEAQEFSNNEEQIMNK